MEIMGSFLTVISASLKTRFHTLFLGNGRGNLFFFIPRVTDELSLVETQSDTNVTLFPELVETVNME